MNYLKLSLIGVAFAIVFTVASAQMFIRSETDSFGCALVNIAASLTQCQAVPAIATQSYYITNLTVQTTTGTAGTFALRSGTGTNCASATAQVFPSSGSGSDRWTAPINTQPSANITFYTPLKVTAGHAICHIGVGTNTTNVQIGGYVR